jgi:hypothetical protein
MIKEVTGAREKVVGRSKDIAAMGPIPGNTPISVPNKTPRKQNKRLTGVRVT